MRALEEGFWGGRLSTIAGRLLGRPEDLRFRLVRDTGGVMILKVGAMGLEFLISVLLARLLGVEEFGLYAFGWSFLALLSIPLAFGLPQLLVREVAASRARGEWGTIFSLVRFARHIALTVSLGLALLVGLGLWLFVGNLPAGSPTVLVIALIGLPVLAFAYLYGGALQGLNRILEGQAVQVLVRPLTFLLLFGGAWLLARELMSASFALGLQVVAAAAALLAGGFLLHHHLSRRASHAPATKANPAWLQSAVWFMLLALLGLIPQHTGVLLLGVMREPKEAGLYKAAFQAASLIPFGLTAVNTVIAPTLSQLYASGEMRKLRRVALLAAGASVCFALPPILFYLLAGSWFLGVTFGKDFAAGAGALTILTIGQTVNAVAGPVGLLLIMSEYERLATVSTGVSSAINIILSLLLIPVWGIQGAATAMTLSLITFNLTALYFVTTRLGVVRIARRRR